MGSEMCIRDSDRRMDVAYTRLRMGRTGLVGQSKGYLIDRPTPCGHQDITFDHVFFDKTCHNFTKEREHLEEGLLKLGVGVINQKLLLFPPKSIENEVRDLQFTFLRETGYINHI